MKNLLKPKNKPDVDKLRAEKIVHLQNTMKTISEMKFYDKNSLQWQKISLSSLENLYDSYLQYLSNHKNRRG